MSRPKKILLLITYANVYPLFVQKYTNQTSVNINRFKPASKTTNKIKHFQKMGQQ